MLNWSGILGMGNRLALVAQRRPQGILRRTSSPNVTQSTGNVRLPWLRVQDVWPPVGGLILPACFVSLLAATPPLYLVGAAMTRGPDVAYATPMRAEAFDGPMQRPMGVAMRYWAVAFALLGSGSLVVLAFLRLQDGNRLAFVILIIGAIGLLWSAYAESRRVRRKGREGRM